MVILTAISYFPVTLSFALRVFALWPDKRALAGVVFTLGLAPVITNGEDMGWAATSYSSPLKLTITTWITPSLRLLIHVTALPGDFVAQGAMLTQEILVIGLTWARTYRQWREAQHIGVPVLWNQAPTSPTNIAHHRYNIFCHHARFECNPDGDLLCAFFVDNAHPVDAEISPQPSKGEIIGGIMNTMPLVLTSRFILNLRQLSEPSEERSFRQPWSSSIFRVSPGTLGNISEPLDLGEYNAYEDNDGEAASEGVENVNCIKEDAYVDIFLRLRRQMIQIIRSQPNLLHDATDLFKVVSNMSMGGQENLAELRLAAGWQPQTSALLYCVKFH
ncbi:uncharacterized protein PHACADRAFT_182150 [Phanerochaete carnosa HHB-10118-sp]|uniref:Uncharacterized protein n=1 Tax=Phanerochaete carnosa (strain HHB-10118-sp) TaxID=650164 RepID=K5WEG5_PHACS|nr:uncharacterized protein PHACADRAFT_182150 [Phanerochaete carnosa HHB-10118-sp]EKM57690.1 hypothetical protein PHACADRAFT_182150 [Phanerochaete carnosa HHB-10118-sp]